MMGQFVDGATRARAVRAAAGREHFDLLITGGSVVDVSLGEIREADIGIVGPMIASIHTTGTRSDALRLVDTSGGFVIPLHRLPHAL
jgi:adenine deaminase